MHLIVGLGNPGKKYEDTRHNLGFLVVQRLAEQLKAKFQKNSLTNGLTAEASPDGKSVELLLPTTYMNYSGLAVKQAMTKATIALENVLIVCDDINLDFGEIRLRSKGSDGGHHGLGSIIEHLGTKDFARLRLGVNAPPSGKDAVNYVLENFSNTAKKKLEDFVERASRCCLVWLNQGIHKAMEGYNKG